MFDRRKKMMEDFDEKWGHENMIVKINRKKLLIMNGLRMKCQVNSEDVIKSNGNERKCRVEGFRKSLSDMRRK